MNLYIETVVVINMIFFAANIFRARQIGRDRKEALDIMALAHNKMREASDLKGYPKSSPVMVVGSTEGWIRKQ